MSPAVPNWRVVVDTILDRIRDGTYPVSQPQPGRRYDERAKLPSTDEFVNEFGFSRAVIRQAVEYLRQTGIVAGAPGKGVYVINLPTEPEPGETPEQLAARIRAMEDFLRDQLGYEPPGQASADSED